MNIIEHINQYQLPDSNLPTKYTRRLGLIVRHQGKFLLEYNEQYGVLSFPNTTLSNNQKEQFGDQQLQDKAIQLLETRTGYHNIKFDTYLQQPYSRTFHKSDKEYNECGLYDKTVLVVDLIDQTMGTIDQNQQRTVTRKTPEELDILFTQDQNYGSSILMWKFYKIQFSELGINN